MVIIFIVIQKFNKLNNLMKISASLIIGGGVSNLVDRIIRGYVVDYIDISAIVSYPIFNIADICIVIGIILIILNILNENIKCQEKN